MAGSESKLQRLFVRAVLAPGARADLDRAQAHYLVNVLRLGDGDGIIVFNGRDGEFRATLSTESRRSHILVIGEQTREQPPPPASATCSRRSSRPASTTWSARPSRWGSPA